MSCYPTHDILPARNGSTNASHDTPNCNNFSSAFIHDFSLMQSEHQEAEKASFSLAFIPTFFKRKGGYIDEWQRRGWRASDQCSGATGWPSIKYVRVSKNRTSLNKLTKWKTPLYMACKDGQCNVVDLILRLLVSICMLKLSMEWLTHASNLLEHPVAVGEIKCVLKYFPWAISPLFPCLAD